LKYKISVKRPSFSLDRSLFLCPLWLCYYFWVFSSTCRKSTKFLLQMPINNKISSLNVKMSKQTHKHTSSYKFLQSIHLFHYFLSNYKRKLRWCKKTVYHLLDLIDMEFKIYFLPLQRLFIFPKFLLSFGNWLNYWSQENIITAN
jgi:hypothetical protein